MKIPNYDKKHKESKRKLNDFLDEDFRMIITDQTRCCKTNTLMQILREPLVYYDKNQEKMVDFQQIMDNYLELGNVDDILDTTEYCF